LSEKFAATRPPKGKKPRVSRQSKIDRTSIQSTATIPTEAISMVAAEEEDTNDTVLTTASVATTAPKATKPKSTKGRGRKKVAAIEDNPENEPESQEATAEPTPARKTKRQASRQVSRSKKKAPAEEVDVPSSAVKKSTRGTKRRSDGSVKDDSSANTTVIHNVESSQSSHGTKRTSDGLAKSEITIVGITMATSQPIVDSSVIILEDPPSVHTTQEARPKRAKRTKKTAPEVVPSDSEAPPKPAPKAKKAKKASSRPPLAELEPEVVQKETEAHKFRSSGFNFTDTIASTPKRDTPEISPDVPSSAPSTPTPARSVLLSSKRKSIQSRSALTPKAVAPKAVAPKVASPAESPQSSDAENKPPSARPSIRGLVIQPISPLRAPAHATPKLSPSRSNIVSRLRTQYSWEPADLDAIFSRHSPKKNASESPKGKENNVANLDLNNLDKKGLSEVVKVVNSRMTDAERKMTVEQWVRWNAQKSEEKLKAECETMVTLFEREGAKAQRALEGIQLRE
jgi:hypothetical protein